jgi:hypothetical protein
MAKLSPFPKKAPKHADAVSIDQLCSWLYLAGDKLATGDAGALVVTPGDTRPDWLPALIEARIVDLQRLTWLREMLTHIDSRIDIMQRGCEPEKAARGITYVQARMREMQAVCEHPDGFYDPADPFALECLVGMRERLARIAIATNALLT